MGNLVQRLSTLAYKNSIEVDLPSEKNLSHEYVELMDEFRFSDAFDFVWNKIQDLNRRIDVEKPWNLAKEGDIEKLQKCLSGLIVDLVNATYELSPFLPNAVERILDVFASPIEPPKIPLFPKA